MINSFSSNWFTLLLLCTSAPLVLYCDRFDRGSRQVKREPVDMVTEDYDVSLCQRVGVHNYYTKDHIILVIGVHLGSSILLYVESLGDKLLLMRTHEDLSPDMELLVYVFYGFVVIFYLVHTLEYMKLVILPAFLEGAVFLKRRKMQMTTKYVLTMKNGKHVVYFLNIINLLSIQVWSRPMPSFKKRKCIHEKMPSLSLYC